MTAEKSSNRSWLGAFGACAGVAVTVALIFSYFRGFSSIPRLDRQQFDQQLAKWRAHKPDNYDLTVAVTGRQPAVYHVTIRGGVATAATLDGRALRDQRTFGTWSVSGMFDTLRRDLRTNDEQNYLLLRCEFDPEYGYPKAYERIEMRTYAHDALQWNVTDFEVKTSNPE